MLSVWIHSVCVVGAANKKARNSEGHKEVEESGRLACLGSREGLCAEVKFHLRPEGGGVGEGDFSRRRSSRCPGPEKRAGGGGAGAQGRRMGGDDVRGPVGLFCLKNITVLRQCFTYH